MNHTLEPPSDHLILLQLQHINIRQENLRHRALAAPPTQNISPRHQLLLIQPSDHQINILPRLRIPHHLVVHINNFADLTGHGGRAQHHLRPDLNLPTLNLAKDLKLPPLILLSVQNRDSQRAILIFFLKADPIEFLEEGLALIPFAGS